MQSSMHPSFHQNLPSLSFTASAAENDPDMSIGLHKRKATKARTEEDEVERRRQRNRMHQARYKMKQRQLVVDLADDIQKLREEIQQLQVQRHTISYGVPASKTVWSVAAEYFRLFRNGSQLPETAVGATSSRAVCAVDFQVQRNFLRATMSSDVVGETGCGVEALLETWKMITLLHEDINVQLLRLDQGAAGSLVATTKVTFSINENTMRLAFPHLVSVDEAGNWSPLAAKLLGQQLVVRGAVRLIWDEVSGRMISVQNEADMLTPMLQLLGSLEDVSCVFDNALVTPACKFAMGESLKELSRSIK
ncbi:hypothetical protein PHYBOEH_005362 [Phytophthora boehmeriae]|uniref:BZIP domain-containing protein n=1 Tax=Phytophthora boehmeriae TaxID=109152 RepID=A0A8T1WK80_9STRA|nr:hypothetical protein PHYBOEH_005362 [Phytophthora boehmeriae]